MGYIRHHAILCTGWRSEIVDAARDMVIKLANEQEFDSDIVSEIAVSQIGSFHSFVVFPDGSKEGWETSDGGNYLRSAIIKYLVSIQYEDGSSPIAWAEVQYGDDNGDNKMIMSSD